MVRVGNGLLLKIDFADGGVCDADRTFLVINVEKENIHLLNISSLRGKERKLGFSSNKNIIRYKPPFMKPSFVKMDALYIIPNDEWIDSKILCDNRCMNPLEINNIIQDYTIFRESNKINIKVCTKDELLIKNEAIVQV